MHRAARGCGRGPARRSRWDHDASHGFRTPIEELTCDVAARLRPTLPEPRPQKRSFVRFFTNRSSVLLRRNHFRDPANAGVAGIQVALLVPGDVISFDELALPCTRSVTHRT